MIYNVGDRVICHTSDDCSIIFDADFDDPRYKGFATEDFEIIGHHNNQYIILVPASVDNTFCLTEAICKAFGVEQKREGYWGLMIRYAAVSGRIEVDYYATALQCIACKEYFPYAEPNQEDGRFACWSCKTDERYKVIYRIR